MKARRAAQAALRYGAAIAICGADREKVEAEYELRRLDAGGEYWEVLEHREALSLTMKGVRDRYERALELFAGGEKEEAALLLGESLELVEDGPTRVLLGRVAGGRGIGLD